MMHIQLALTLRLVTDIYYCDEMRIIQILINLITNAIKFSRKNSVVQIDVAARNLQNGVTSEITIAVKDFGIGINDVDKALLFKPYFVTTDLASRQMNTNGHGIGLSVCKNIAEAMDASLTV